ncbi:hypothetical protein GBF38_007386, partial [Nibea albiflora]
MEATSFQRLPGDFKYLSNKERRRRQERREGGPATIPRPSFTNYTEYLLTVYHVLWRGSSSHLQASAGDKREKEEDKEDEGWRKVEESLAPRREALISETL